MAVICGRCLRSLSGSVFEVRSGEGTLARCLRCALMFRPLVLRSLKICVIIGTFLTAINQRPTILGGEASLALVWQVPLTYAVPFGVATTSAIVNARSKRST